MVTHDPDIEIPVAFSPPHIPVAEAGLLVDGQVDARETAATIIDLAVRGALTVQSTGDNDFRVTLVDPNRAAAPHEMVLLNALFYGEPPGAVADLSAQGSLTTAHKALQTSVPQPGREPRLVPQGAVGHDRPAGSGSGRSPSRSSGSSRSASGCCGSCCRCCR